jgi:hypothetical protein
LNQDLREQILIRAKTPEAACVGFGARSPLKPAWFSDPPERAAFCSQRAEFCHPLA